jgi:hypothetical protein
MAEYNGSLVCGGKFDRAGGTRVSCVASWDGRDWNGLGPGLQDGWYGVLGFAEYDGSLVACGDFQRSSTTELHGIARWDGSNWLPFGSGVNGTVADVAVYRGQVIAVGHFSSAGGTFAPGIARWDGSSWHALASEFDLCGQSQCDPLPDGRLAVFQDELYVAGMFGGIDGVHAEGIARWNGTSWRPVGDTPLHTAPCDLTVFEDRLIAGGYWTSELLAWDGREWSPMHGWGPGWHGTIWNMTLHEGRLGIVGELYFEPVSLDGNAWWNWQDWTRILMLRGDHFQRLGTDRSDARFLTAASHGGRLYVGGDFDAFAGIPAHDVMAWDGTAWEPVGAGAGIERLHGHASVRAFTEYQGNLIAAGDFDLAGSTPAHSIARWDGAAWADLGAGIHGTVHSLALYGDELVAGGDFDTAGGLAAHGIAAWDGTQWRAFGTGLSTGGVRAMTSYQGKLVAVGSFHRAGDREAHGVAAWDGTGWTRIGFGLFPEPSVVVVYGGELIVAGDIDWNGYEHLRVARWDGSRWRPLGQMDAVVSDLLPYAGGLLAATSKGPAFWDGSTWSAWNPTSDGNPRELVLHGEDLYGVEGLRPEQLVFWDGGTWRRVGSKLNGSVYVLASHDGHLYLGGDFSAVGEIPSASVARWEGVGSPRLEPAAAGPRIGARSGPRAADAAALRAEPDGSGVRIEFTVTSERSRVRLAVYDARGRLVRVLRTATLDPGVHTAHWERNDTHGSPVPRGIYFLQLRAAGEQRTHKFLLVDP